MAARAAVAPELAPSAPGGERLPASFFARPVLRVARELIGCVVEHDGVSGAIVETEAYHHSEPACHAFAGLTPRTRTLFGDPAHAYVYRSYGIHTLLNTVAERRGVGAGVLIRALHPLTGIEAMRARRGVARDEDLCSGPGKLTQALGVPLDYNGVSLLDGPIAIFRPSRTTAGMNRAGTNEASSNGAGPRTNGAGAGAAGRGSNGVGRIRIVTGPRIGITRATDLPWRFCLAGSPHVSRPHPPGLR
jgi:DNA-3-methyladenine glycosylase